MRLTSDSMFDSMDSAGAAVTGDISQWQLWRNFSPAG
jgi:hypothetical protein